MEIRMDEYCVRPEATLRAAIEAMDRFRRGLAFVVDGASRLVGVVSDGDLRRALLKGYSLDHLVREVMCSDPLVVRNHATDQEVMSLLQSERYSARKPTWIPVVDGNDRLVGIRELTDLMIHVDGSSGSIQKAARGARVLVIGGAGYIGAMLVRQLLNAGYYVTVLDRLSYGDASLRGLGNNPCFRLVRGDTRHIDDLVPAFRDANAVVHMAELVGDPLCQQDPETTFQINYLATASIARICDYLQINRFVYLSSCSVYGSSSDPDVILEETSLLRPVSLYAKTKINSERVILSLDTGNFSPCILRLGTVYGLSHRPRFDLVVNALAAHAALNQEIHVYGGEQWRPHVHVSDVASAIQAVLEAPLERVRNQIINVVGENQRINGIVGMILESFPGCRAVRHADLEDRRNYRVSSEKARRLIGFDPQNSVRGGILEIAEALRSGKIGDPWDREYHNVLAFQEAPQRA